MVVLGLTGGIACGKSTVARWLVARGALLIDADEVAREVVQPGTPGLRDVVDQFGVDMVQEDGTLDRARLGALVFAEAKSRHLLNELLHPRIVAAMRRALDDAEADDAALAVVDAALLLELGLDKWCDAVLDVESTPDLQVDRLVARNGLSTQAARQRVAAQWAPEQRRPRATWVLENVGTVDDLSEALARIWADALERFPELAQLPDVLRETDEEGA